MILTMLENRDASCRPFTTESDSDCVPQYFEYSPSKGNKYSSSSDEDVMELDAADNP